MNRLMALCLWGLAGCFSPLVVEGTHCSDKGECPPQLTCVEGVCRLPGTVADAAPPDASLPAIADARERVADAPPDAPPPADAPPNGPPPADAPPNGPPWVGVTAGPTMAALCIAAGRSSAGVTITWASSAPARPLPSRRPAWSRGSTTP